MTQGPKTGRPENNGAAGADTGHVATPTQKTAAPATPETPAGEMPKATKMAVGETPKETKTAAKTAAPAKAKTAERKAQKKTAAAKPISSVRASEKTAKGSAHASAAPASTPAKAKTKAKAKAKVSSSATTVTKKRKTTAASSATPAQDIMPNIATGSEPLLSGLNAGMALYVQSLSHFQRTAACWTRYCANLTDAHSGMDVFHAHESLIRERYDDIARDSIATATLLFETGSEMTDRMLSDR